MLGTNELIVFNDINRNVFDETYASLQRWAKSQNFSDLEIKIAIFG